MASPSALASQDDGLKPINFRSGLKYSTLRDEKVRLTYPGAILEINPSDSVHLVPRPGYAEKGMTAAQKAIGETPEEDLEDIELVEYDRREGLEEKVATVVKKMIGTSIETYQAPDLEDYVYGKELTIRSSKDIVIPENVEKAVVCNYIDKKAALCYKLGSVSLSQITVESESVSLSSPRYTYESTFYVICDNKKESEACYVMNEADKVFIPSSFTQKTKTISYEDTQKSNPVSHEDLFIGTNFRTGNTYSTYSPKKSLTKPGNYVVFSPKDSMDFVPQPGHAKEGLDEYSRIITKIPAEDLVNIKKFESAVPKKFESAVPVITTWAESILGKDTELYKAPEANESLAEELLYIMSSKEIISSEDVSKVVVCNRADISVTICWTQKRYANSLHEITVKSKEGNESSLWVTCFEDEKCHLMNVKDFVYAAPIKVRRLRNGNNSHQ